MIRTEDLRRVVARHPWKTPATIQAGQLGPGRKRVKGEVKVAKVRKAFEKSGLTKCELARRLDWMRSNIDRVNRALGYRPDSSGLIRETMTYELAVLIGKAIGADYHEIGI